MLHVLSCISHDKVIFGCMQFCCTTFSFQLGAYVLRYCVLYKIADTHSVHAEFHAPPLCQPSHLTTTSGELHPLPTHDTVAGNVPSVTEEVYHIACICAYVMSAYQAVANTY